MRIPFLIVIFLGFIPNLISQGCSDAGMCTVAGLSSGFDDDTKSNIVRLSSIFGLGEQNVFHAELELSAEYSTFKNQSIQVKIPYRTTIGNLGTVSGLGDMVISLNQKLVTFENGWLSAVAGIKIPTNDANKSLNGNPLPMAYQTSLGTYDMIIGLGGYYKKWHFSAGYQHSFGRNENKFLHRDDNPEYFNNYQESYHLKRADDIILRVERQFKLKKSTLAVGALPIYHLANDEIKEGEEVPNSSGLTFNLNTKLDIAMKNDWKVNFMLAAPIIDKENRPDGLTRSFVAVVSFSKSL